MSDPAHRERRWYGLFAIGGLLFFLGGIALMLAEYNLPPSLARDLVAVAALALLGLGLLVALVAYLGLLGFRLRRFFRTEENPNQDERGIEDKR